MSNREKKISEIDSLSLLAHKVAPNVFDLSSSQINVSIRDQMVRARQLIIDLKAAHPKAQSILIIGMGAAGMTATLTACEVGFGTVCAVENAAQPFSMFRNVTSRFVGPFMYEWPSPFHSDQSYPSHNFTPWADDTTLSPLVWPAIEPVSAHELAKLLTKSVKDWGKKFYKETNIESLPYLIVKVDKKKVQNFVKAFAKAETVRAVQDTNGESRSDKAKFSDFGVEARIWSGLPLKTLPSSIEPDFVILAAGMGREIVRIPGVRRNACPRFWADDELKQDKVANQRVVVLGGGDGAIQDSLRALTVYHHPLSFIRDLEKVPTVLQRLENELPALLSADRQLRQHMSWSRDPSAFVMIDNACRKAAQKLAQVPEVLQEVEKALRKGTGEVYHLVKDNHFGKAYLLNRFVIYLLSSCVGADSSKKNGHMGFTLTFNAEVERGEYRNANATDAKWRLKIISSVPGTAFPPINNVDNVVVRFGIQSSSIPGPRLIQLSDKYPKHRTTLNRVELPFVAMAKIPKPAL